MIFFLFKNILKFQIFCQAIIIVQLKICNSIRISKNHIYYVIVFIFYIYIHNNSLFPLALKIHFNPNRLLGSSNRYLLPINSSDKNLNRPPQYI
jgi:hypothetical protein